MTTLSTTVKGFPVSVEYDEIGINKIYIGWSCGYDVLPILRDDFIWLVYDEVYGKQKR